MTAGGSGAVRPATHESTGANGPTLVLWGEACILRSSRAPLAQLDRASVYGTEGCWFEPSGVYLIREASRLCAAPPGRQKSRRSGFFAIALCGDAFPGRGEKSKSSSSFRRSRLAQDCFAGCEAQHQPADAGQEKTTRCRVFRERSSSSFRRSRLHRLCQASAQSAVLDAIVRLNIDL